MKNTSLKTKILTALLTGGILLSAVSTTFAATATPNATDVTTNSRLKSRVCVVRLSNS